MYNPAQESNVQAVYNEIFEPEIEYKKPETPTPENLPKLQQAIPNNSCTEENSNPTDSNPKSVPEESCDNKPDTPEDKPESPEEKPADQTHVDTSMPEKGKKTVNRKRKYQKRKSITAKRRKPTKTANTSRKNIETKTSIPKDESEPCPAPLFSNTDSSDDEVTIPESLIEDNPPPNESEKSNLSNKGRKRNSPESGSQKSAEIGFVRRSSRQSVPPTEVYQSFRLSPKRKPVLKKEVPTKNTPLAVEVKPEVQESHPDRPDDDRPMKTSEEESTFDTNCPPPPFVCVTDTDSESSDPGSPNPPRITQKIANKTPKEPPKENVRRSGRASKRPAKYSQGSTTSPEVNAAVTVVPEPKKTVWKSVVIQDTAETNDIDWKERYDELKKKFDEQAKELENEKLKNLKLEVEHLRERNQLQVNKIFISETGFPTLELIPVCH